jgi:hypothetical protein
MMMIFGRLDTFAIEAELREVCDSWVYGRLRLCVGGQCFGEWDDSPDLAASARSGRMFLAASVRRTRPDLDAMNAAEAYELLYGRYLYRASRSTTRRPEYWDRDPYLLDDVGDSSTRDKQTFLVVRRGDGADRVIVKTFDPDRLDETIVPAGVCDEVIAAYCGWVESLSGART